jgi:hypothetical protein
MGIGGLDAEFSAIFRRAFASRVFPPEVLEQIGMFIVVSYIHLRLGLIVRKKIVSRFSVQD